MSNTKKGNILYHLWVTKEEERLMFESMGSLPSFVWELIKKINLRGDLQKY